MNKNCFIFDESFAEVPVKKIQFKEDIRIFSLLFRKSDGDSVILESNYVKDSIFTGYLHESSDTEFVTLEIFLLHGDLENRYIEGEIPSDFIDFLLEEEFEKYDLIIIPNIHKDKIEVLD
jgi:hypothetical protein